MRFTLWLDPEILCKPQVSRMRQNERLFFDLLIIGSLPELLDVIA